MSNSLLDFFKEEPSRWCKQIRNGKYCLHMAFLEVYGGKLIDNVHHIRIRLAIKELFPHFYGGGVDLVVSFNDHPTTTFDDILKVLERAQV